MSEQAIPEELQALRNNIDQIDEELLVVLAKRFEYTRQVGQLKAEKQLNSFDPERERLKFEALAALAQANSLDVDFVLNMFKGIFDEVVENHKQYLN